MTAQNLALFISHVFHKIPCLQCTCLPSIPYLLAINFFAINCFAAFLFMQNKVALFDRYGVVEKKVENNSDHSRVIKNFKIHAGKARQRGFKLSRKMLASSWDALSSNCVQDIWTLVQNTYRWKTRGCAACMTWCIRASIISPELSTFQMLKFGVLGLAERFWCVLHLAQLNIHRHWSNFESFWGETSLAGGIHVRPRKRWRSRNRSGHRNETPGRIASLRQTCRNHCINRTCLPSQSRSMKSEIQRTPWPLWRRSYAISNATCHNSW